MPRGKGGEAVIAFAQYNNGIIEIDFLNRTWCGVPNEAALKNRQYCLNVAKVPWINWSEVDPNPVKETSGFGKQVNWYEDNAPAIILHDVDSGWEYGIAPNWFQNLSSKDEHGVNQITTGKDAGLFSRDVLYLNWVQIMSLRDVMCQTAKDGIYAGKDDKGQPIFR